MTAGETLTTAGPCPAWCAGDHAGDHREHLDQIIKDNRDTALMDAIATIHVLAHQVQVLMARVEDLGAR